MGGGAILLHAARLAFDRPVGEGRLVVDAPLPSHWKGWLRRHDGFAAAARAYFAPRRRE